MALHRCFQQKGIRRKKIREDYKQHIFSCSNRFPIKSIEYIFCRIKTFFIYAFATIWNWLQLFSCLLFEIIRLLPLWIYELFRFCPFKIKNLDTDSFLIIGHRGVAAYEIENTIPAFEKAIDQYGANAIEIDLSFTKDHEIVLWHDWNPDDIVAMVRQAGWEPTVKYRPFVPMSGMWRKPVNQILLSELRDHYGYALKKKYPVKLEAHIPTFKEFMDWVIAKNEIKTVLLDIKLPVKEIELVPLFTHILHQIINETQPHFNCIILSPEEQIIRTMKMYLAENIYSFDMELPVGIVIDPPAFSSVKKAVVLQNAYACVGRPNILQLGPWTTYRRVVQFDILKKIDFNNTSPDVPIEKLIGWTINSKREMRCLIKMGIDGILTDKPDKLNKILTKYTF